MNDSTTLKKSSLGVYLRSFKTTIKAKLSHVTFSAAAKIATMRAAMD